jgi:hypothetical protein
MLAAVSGIKHFSSRPKRIDDFAPDMKAGLSSFEPTTDLRPLIFALKKVLSSGN